VKATLEQRAITLAWIKPDRRRSNPQTPAINLKKDGQPPGHRGKRFPGYVL